MSDGYTLVAINKQYLCQVSTQVVSSSFLPIQHYGGTISFFFAEETLPSKTSSVSVYMAISSESNLLITINETLLVCKRLYNQHIFP